MTPREQLAEVIAEVTNLKVLEIYRECHRIEDARSLDDHLTDLGKRIVEALGELPEDDARIQLHGPLLPLLPEDTERVLRRMLNTPPQPNNSPASTTGGQESAIDANHPAEGKSVGADPSGDQTVPPDKMSGSPEKPPGPAVLADRINAWMKREEASILDLSACSGVTQKTIYNILNGATKNPAESTRIKIVRVIENREPPPAKKKPAKPERVNGAGKPTKAPRGAIQFLQLQVGKYRKEKGCTNGGAAVDFGIPIHALEALENGRLPSTCSIARIAARIPEVEANRRVLFEARRRQENGAGAH